ARAEAVILRDQSLGRFGVLHALADLARDEVGNQRVRRLVGEDVAEIALPDAEALLAVKLLEERLALLRRHLEDAARVRGMQEAGESLAAAREHLGIARPDPAHL